MILHLHRGGVFRAIQASNNFLWSTDELSGLTVAIQGCGNVGYNPRNCCMKPGARLIVTDVNAENLSSVVNEFGGRRSRHMRFSACVLTSLRPALSVG